MYPIMHVCTYTVIPALPAPVPVLRIFLFSTLASWMLWDVREAERSELTVATEAT